MGAFTLRLSAGAPGNIVSLLWATLGAASSSFYLLKDGHEQNCRRFFIGGQDPTLQRPTQALQSGLPRLRSGEAAQPPAQRGAVTR